MAKKFLRCKTCGQIIEVINDTGVPIVCCGDQMEEIYPEVEEGVLADKHIPVYKIKDKKVEVKIGSIQHPSTVEHYIQWISIETSKGSQYKKLKPGDAPEATFVIGDGEIVKAIYAFCNIHSLWKVSLKPKTAPCGCELHLE